MGTIRPPLYGWSMAEGFSAFGGFSGRAGDSLEGSAGGCVPSADRGVPEAGDGGGGAGGVCVRRAGGGVGGEKEEGEDEGRGPARRDDVGDVGGTARPAD